MVKNEVNTQDEVKTEDEVKVQEGLDLDSLINTYMIVDTNQSEFYSNQAISSAAIDEIFNTSSILNMDGELNYPYYWSSTSHLDGKKCLDGYQWRL